MKNISITALLALSLIGCGGSGSDSEIKEDNTQQEQPEQTFSLLNIIIPQAIADEAPPGTQITVEISGNGVNKSQTLGSAETSITFNDLVIGEYTVTTIVMASTNELARDQQDFNLTENTTTLNANLILNKASLEITPLLSSDYTIISGTYEGEFQKTGCLSTPFNPAPTDLTVTVTGLASDFEFSLFPDPTLKLTGDLDDTSGELVSSGIYQSSDFTNGDWTVDKILTPSENTIYIRGQLIDVTNSNCTTEFEYIGIK